jgi:hypothetical protein
MAPCEGANINSAVSDKLCCERMSELKETRAALAATLREERIAMAETIKEGHGALVERVRSLESWHKTLVVLAFAQLLTLVFFLAGKLM